MSQPKVVHRYRYDPLNRLIETAGIQRFYNTTRMATEIQGAVQHSVFQSGGVLLAQTRREGTKADCTLLATGFQRSVLHGVSPDKVEPIAYNVYGHRPAHSGLLSVLGFNGERPDPITGHYLLGNGYRAFNPALMRFNSPDSLSPFGKGGVNCYAYCEGDPINRYDPTGHFSFNGFFKVARSKFINKFVFNSRKQYVSNVKELGGELYQFTHVSAKNTKTLSIDGHGFAQSGKSVIFEGDNQLFAADLVKLIEENGTRLKDYGQIRLLACDVASGDFAQEMANITGVPTKAYKGDFNISYGGRHMEQFIKHAQRKQKVPIYLPGDNRISRMFDSVNSKSIRFHPLD